MISNNLIPSMKLTLASLIKLLFNRPNDKEPSFNKRRGMPRRRQPYCVCKRLDKRLHHRPYCACRHQSMPRLAVGLVETRPDPRVPDPTGSLGNPTRPAGYPRAYSGGSGRVGLQYKACGSGWKLKIVYFKPPTRPECRYPTLWVVLATRPDPTASLQ